MPDRGRRVGRVVHGSACAQIESPLIREVRGLGLMVGIELKQKVTPYLQELMAARRIGAARRADRDALPAAARG